LTPVLVNDWLRAMQVTAELSVETERLARNGVASRMSATMRADRADPRVAHWQSEEDPEAWNERTRRGTGRALDMLRRARLFALSPGAVDAALLHSKRMVGTPELDMLPFDVCVFGVRDSSLEGPPDGAQLVAILASRCGTIIGIDPKGEIVLVTAVNADGWDAGSILPAWACFLFAALVAGHVSERQPPIRSFDMNRKLAAIRKLGVAAPPPDLYVLNLDRRRASAAIGRIIEARNGPAYRYEVRQHERMLVHRGRWPCGDELREDFATRGYVVERGDSLDERAAIGLDLRGLPAGERNEWIAWRFARVREHEAGPKDAPLRRAVRVAT
jgi:hypothetical protein